MVRSDHHAFIGIKYFLTTIHNNSANVEKIQTSG